MNLYPASPLDRRPGPQVGADPPGQVTFFYDSDGLPTLVEDRNGNTLTFTSWTPRPAEDPGGPKKRITTVTDAGGRTSHRLLSQGRGEEGPRPRQHPADHRPLGLARSTSSTTTTATCAADPARRHEGQRRVPGRPVVRLHLHHLLRRRRRRSRSRRPVEPDPNTPNQSTRLFSVRDPRGSETLSAYLGPGNGAAALEAQDSRTDRAGAVTDYGYDITGRVTTVTAAALTVTGTATTSPARSPDHQPAQPEQTTQSVDHRLRCSRGSPSRPASSRVTPTTPTALDRRWQPAERQHVPSRTPGFQNATAHDDTAANWKAGRRSLT